GPAVTAAGGSAAIDAPAAPSATGAATATTAASAAPSGGDRAAPTTTPASTAGGEGTPSLPSVAVDPATFGRDVVYTATVALEVDDVAGATRRATAAVTAAGGFLFGQHT